MLRASVVECRCMMLHGMYWRSATNTRRSTSQRHAFLHHSSVNHRRTFLCHLPSLSSPDLKIHKCQNELQNSPQIMPAYSKLFQTMLHSWNCTHWLRWDLSNKPTSYCKTFCTNWAHWNLQPLTVTSNKCPCSVFASEKCQVYQLHTALLDN